MGRVSHGEFQEYLGLLGRLLRLRTTRRTAIEDELRTHMEERFAALTGQGLEPEQAIRMALAEFGDAATLAAEFSAISRLQKRRWMMRLTVGSIAATLVLSAAVVSMWPAGSGELLGPMAHAQVVDVAAPVEAPAEALTEQEANAQTQEKLKKLVSVECKDSPLNDAMAYLGALAGVQVHIDSLALENEQLTVEEPVSINLKDVPADLVFRLDVGTIRTGLFARRRGADRHHAGGAGHEAGYSGLPDQRSRAAGCRAGGRPAGRGAEDGLRHNGRRPGGRSHAARLPGRAD